MTLYPHQLTSINYHLLHAYSINGSGMGVGKTRIALEFIKRTGKRGLIVGPAFLRGTWESEARECEVTNYEYIPYSQIHKYDSKDLMGFGTWVADEVHFLKTATAMRAHAYYSLLKKCKPDFWLGLSGTPIKNKVPDLWVPLAICSQCPTDSNGLRLEGELTKYRAFSRHFCNVEIMNIRGARVEKYSGIKEARIPELRALLKDKYIRFKIEDVVNDMPSMTHKDVQLNLRPVAGLEETFKAYCEGSKIDPTSKAASALLKSSTTVEYVEDMLETGEAVLVFSDHVLSAEAIAKGLKTVCVTGKMPAEERNRIVERFQRGEFKSLVATIGSLSVGVTLTAARHVVFNDLSWTHSDNIQAGARIHRIGQKQACFSHYMLGSPTDEHIAKVLRLKAETTLRILGG